MQYEAVVGHAIPAIGAKEVPEDSQPVPSWSLERAEAALFRRIAQEEKKPAETGEVRQVTSVDSSGSGRRVLPFAGNAAWRYVWTLYAAGILLAVSLGICIYQVGIRRVANTRKAVPFPLDAQNQTSLEAQVSDAAHEREVTRTQLKQRDREIADLRQQLQRQAVEINQMEVAQDRLEIDLRSSDAGKQNLRQRQAELKQRSDAAQGNALAQQQKLDMLVKQSSGDQARAVQLEVHVKRLIQAMRDRDAALDQKDQLLAKDRDIRELMGARDLYVAEAYDVARSGETQKPYGRVFYTKGKSLIFYAYDLDQQTMVKSASIFQAWGRSGPDRTQAVNLGIFYEDNVSKKRWILKLDDSRTLAQIDAVFVTVEPNGGSQKPSGKSLLFANLNGDPNHP
jgi:hypothetical protein